MLDTGSSDQKLHARFIFTYTYPAGIFYVRTYVRTSFALLEELAYARLISIHRSLRPRIYPNTRETF